MQTCRKCGVGKPLDHFEEYNKERHWRRKTCNQCISAYRTAWRKESKEHLRESKRRYHQDNRDKIIARVNEWVMKNPEKRRRNALEYYYRLQVAAMEAYGGYRCACCGEDEPLFLTLDHVNDDGSKHRAQIGKVNIYRWLRDNGYPEGFQVLCMNCNHGRMRNGGICPHQEEGVTTRATARRVKRPEARGAPPAK